MAGRVIEVAEGEELDLGLEEVSTSGYVWMLQMADPGLHVVGTELELPTGGRVGAPGIRHFRLRAPRPGKYHVAFELRREWEAEPVKRASFQVVVRGKSLD
jgi:inhibitor of cysteine peptidase